jgi:hypothetical protein
MHCASDAILLKPSIRASCFVTWIYTVLEQSCAAPPAAGAEVWNFFRQSILAFCAWRPKAPSTRHSYLTKILLHPNPNADP